MAENHISLTIPRDDNDALVAGATMLLTLAGKVPTLELPNTSDEQRPYEPGEIGRAAAAEANAKCNEIITPEPTTETPAPAAPAPVPVAEVPSIVAEEAKPGIDLDARGLPWDERIHAGTKSKTADGNWKKKRGVDAAVIEQVEQELTNLMAIPSEIPVSLTSGLSSDEAVDALAAMEAERNGTAAAPTPPADGEIYPEYSDKPLSEWRFPDFLKAVSKAIVAGETTMDAAHATCAKHGVQNMHLIGNREDLIPTIWQGIVGHG